MSNEAQPSLQHCTLTTPRCVSMGVEERESRKEKNKFYHYGIFAWTGDHVEMSLEPDEVKDFPPAGLEFEAAFAHMEKTQYGPKFRYAGVGNQIKGKAAA